MMIDDILLQIRRTYSVLVFSCKNKACEKNSQEINIFLTILAREDQSTNKKHRSRADIKKSGSGQNMPLVERIIIPHYGVYIDLCLMLLLILIYHTLAI